MAKSSHRRKDLIQAVREHHARNPAQSGGTTHHASLDPKITRFGTIVVSQKKGVEIRSFSTENTPLPGDLPRLVINWAIERLLAARGLFGSRPHGITKYVDAIEHSLRSQNWFGALFLSLAMPDICGALQSPTKAPLTRYKDWFASYLASNYITDLFSGNDFYYLRCAVLHQGLSEHPKAQNKQVVFVTPAPGGHVFHSNFVQSEDGSFVLQLQIDIFCKQVCFGVEQWQRDMAGSPDVLKRIEELLEFQDPTKPFKSKA